MIVGQIARLLSDRKMGFIRTDDGRDFLFHSIDLQGTVFELLEAGQQVTFDEDATIPYRAVRVTTAGVGQ